ncbi:aryl-sulfate sulfotransferase [Christensenellaceae bacterium OttesenSCG-928-K19]|nr:aryl-sulfate sulfotransferase [Christensenellaceae bacterium OttesenSCG-928-K19]
MMKKTIAIISAILLCFVFLAGCDSNVIPQRPSGIINVEGQPSEAPAQGSSMAPQPEQTTDQPAAEESAAAGDSSSLFEETTQGSAGNTSTEVSGGITNGTTTSPSPSPTAPPSPSATASPAPSTEPSTPPSEAPTQEPSPGPSIPLTQKILHLTVNGHSLDLPLEKNNAVFDVSTLNTEYAAVFQLKTDDSDLSVMLDSKKAQPGQDVEIKINRIAYNEYIPVTVTDGRDIRTLFLRTLNSNIPTLTPAGKSESDGHYYLSFVNRPLVLKLDAAGEIVYYYYGPEQDIPVAQDIAATAESANEDQEDEALVTGPGLWDFKKHTLPDGAVRYSYLEQNLNYNQLVMEGYAAGERVILDEKYQEVDRVQMAADKDGKVYPAEGHDFIMLEDGHYLLSNYELQLVDNIPVDLSPHPQGSKVVATHLQEVKDNEVLLDWYSTDHPELYSLSEDGYNDYANETTQQPDYIHFNSMIVDPADDNLICSFRNMSTIAKIDRESGDILWLLSGDGDQFGLMAEQKTSNQHYVRLTEDGYLTIFDNHNSTESTRILKLKLDEEEMTVAEYEEFEVPGRFSMFCGNADSLGGNTFCIGWGIFEGDGATLTEIDFDSNQKLFELTLPAGELTYRCAKYE